MFNPIKGGTLVTIEQEAGTFKCWIPPVGYGAHNDTGEISETDIIKRSGGKKEQYWERPQLPKDFERREFAEAQERIKLNNPDYFDPELENIREREWNRRLYGVWFWNNGVQTYITGTHYMLLTYWKFQGKYFDYREPNREHYYILQYCIEDANSLGLIEVTKRKEGKTARAGLFLYEYISRTAAKHGGIQSKTDEDAKEVYLKAVMHPWRKLPSFFRPIFDTAKGDAPQSELRFFNSSQKGRNKVEAEEALESFIDYKPASTDAYDGPELHRYVSDEAGKLKKISITDRHDVVMMCSEVDGDYVGKQLYTTTVEEMESGGADFKELVKRSDMKDRDMNGRTKSGLYVYFLPAYRTLFYDKYGFPDEVRAKEFYMNKRAALADNPRALSSYIRKNPFTLKEAFRVDGDKCIYNPELLNNRRDDLSWRENIAERGDFMWKDAIRDSKVVWTRNSKGRFWMKNNFEKLGESNLIENRSGAFYPMNKRKFVIGADPFDHDVTKDNRRSMGAAYVKRKIDGTLTVDNVGYNRFWCWYYGRPPKASIFYEDMIMMAVYFGCQILFENNKIGWKAYFIARNYEAFLMRLPGEKEYGVHANPKTHQMMAEATEEHIDSSIDKVDDVELIEDWLEFDLHETTKFDKAMAAGWTLVADERISYRQEREGTEEVGEYLSMYTA